MSALGYFYGEIPEEKLMLDANEAAGPSWWGFVARKADCHASALSTCASGRSRQ